MIAPNDKITTDKLGELYFPNPTGHLTWASYPPQPFNPIWWASADAAINMATRYNGKVVAKAPYYPEPPDKGMVYSPSIMLYVEIGNAIINAGELCQSFHSRPEDVAPGAADALNHQLIQMYQAGG